MSQDKILIIGGYGAVGTIIASHLSRRYPNKVIIAGRSIEKAQETALKLEHGVSSMYIDVAQPNSFGFSNEVKLVIMCLDIVNTAIVDYCIAHGIQYLDITANYDVMQTIESLHTKAVNNNVGLFLSVGLAPGLSNLLARYLSSQMKEMDTLDIFILLGIGEAHGDKAFQWTFDNINSTYYVKDNDTNQKLKSFTGKRTTDLLGKKDFYLFNFSDQHVIAQNLNVKKVRTRLAFDVNILTRLVAWMRKWGLSGIYKYSWVQKIMTRILQKSIIGTNVFGVKVIASGKDQIMSAQINGLEEGNITALVAVLVASKIYSDKHLFGVQHLDQVIDDIPEFLEQLKKIDTTFQIQLS